MQTTANVICVMQTLGSKGESLTRIYRQLYNENLYISAYSRLYANKGTLTPGATAETVDGMSIGKIRKIIAQLRTETYRWTPVRRHYIQKKDSKKRPLGLPTWSDKLLEEVIRLLLDAYYEPVFSPHSHGYRQGRGCHTALQEIVTKWSGTVWFLEGDIRGCFDQFDHRVLLDLLGKRIKDNRLLRLIRHRLESGILEDWQYQQSYSGAPQGGVLSPLLANIYLHEMDEFVQNRLLSQWNRGGARRKVNPAYHALANKVYLACKSKKRQPIQKWRKAMRQMPSQDVFNPDYRRLRYVRYADDFLLGFVGSKAEAKEILAQIETFLSETLCLQMSEKKSKVTHAKTKYARFLGYDIGVYGNQLSRRSANGNICLRLPAGYVAKRSREWQKNGKPRINGLAMAYSAEEALLSYQMQFWGIVNYYRYAVDVSALTRLKYAMERSLVSTLATKFRVSTSKIYRRYRGKMRVKGRTYEVLQSTITRDDGKELTFTWGGIPLRRQRFLTEPLDDKVVYGYQGRSEIVARMSATECELCRCETDELEGHHVKKLADLPKKWKKGPPPQWVVPMIARRRKTLFVCKTCHGKIHAKSVQG
jgi:group II intron reverse transcriptase/maturase